MLLPSGFRTYDITGKSYKLYGESYLEFYRGS